MKYYEKIHGNKKMKSIREKPKGFGALEKMVNFVQFWFLQQLILFEFNSF